MKSIASKSIARTATLIRTGTLRAPRRLSLARFSSVALIGLGLSLGLGIGLGVGDAFADHPHESAKNVGSPLDLEAVQGILAVQGLDGWLLMDQAGQNRIARELVNPAGRTSRRWFYLVPAQGQPVMLVHRAEAASFASIPGRKIEYTGHRDLKRGLRSMLKGIKTVGMEYAPKSGIASLSLVDAATVELVRSVGVKIQSSAQLVQFSKSLWRPLGRIAHYVTVHHLTKVRAHALAYLAREVRAGRPVTEYQLQQYIARRLRTRGVAALVPSVAVNDHAARPNYQPDAKSSAIIRKGDLLLLGLSGSIDGAPRPIFADVTWMAYVGSTVPKRYAEAFAVLVAARNAALTYIEKRVERHRPVKGFQVDQKARAVVGAAGHADRFVHRTGHSLDTRLEGDGANLDDYEAHDTRLLVQGAGFTIAPGIYYPGDFGMRTEIDVYIGPGGVEVTTPAQSSITAILAK